MRSERFIIARDCNVVRVDFRREPDPPSPKFPGAAALRELVPPSDNPVSIHANQTESMAVTRCRPRHKTQLGLGAAKAASGSRYR